MDDPITIRRIPSDDLTWLPSSLIRRYARKISPAAFAVYAVLAMHAGEGNTSTVNLSEDTGLSPKTLSRAIKTLEEAGLLCVLPLSMPDLKDVNTLQVMLDKDSPPYKVLPIGLYPEEEGDKP